MASADPVNLIPSQREAREELNLLKRVIDEKKLEVNQVRDEMKQLIDLKEEEVLRELDVIWEEVNERKEKKRQEIEKNVKDIKLNPTAIPTLEFTESFESVQKEMDIEIPFVKLTWRVDELRDSIHTLCSCSIVKYSEDTTVQLEWSSCARVGGDDQLYSPFGIAINSGNDSIYVTDYYLHRIQIFSKDAIKSVKDEQMTYPEDILLFKNFVFIQCDSSILKLQDSTFERESYKSCEYRIRGICTDNINVYVGVYKEMKLLILTLDLKEENQISLNSKFYKQGKTKIRDISYAEGEFYVLLSVTEYPLQTFSRQGTFLRCLVQKDLLNDACFFCLDQQLNIIVSDNGTDKVKIFSNEGRLIF